MEYAGIRNVRVNLATSDPVPFFSTIYLATYMDVLVTGDTDQQHLQNVDAVLERLKTAGVRLKKSNASSCQLMWSI